jgi:hypothetical protein
MIPPNRVAARTRMHVWRDVMSASLQTVRVSGTEERFMNCVCHLRYFLRASAL